MANDINIRKWVEALRSGKYQQTTQVLSNGTAYCCLGVACEVAIENGVKLVKNLATDASESGSESGVAYDGVMGKLPEKVAYWLGLTFEDESGEFWPVSDPTLSTPDHPRYTATSWNDTEKADFSKIADLIEENYLAKGEPPHQ